MFFLIVKVDIYIDLAIAHLVFYNGTGILYVAYVLLLECSLLLG